MQKLLLTGCGILMSLSMAGCVVTSPGLGDDAGSASLPSGLRLLDSDKGECDGTIQVSEETIEGEGDGLESEFSVEPGEHATFEFERPYEEFEWSCLDDDDDSPDVDTEHCPDGSTHVRITRASSGGELLFECYG